MQKCPYCAELIQDDALKCRFCHEWLNNKQINYFSDFVSTTKKLVSDTLNNKAQTKQSHLFIPTEGNPIKIQHALFYPDRLTVNDYVKYYKDIVMIYCDVKTRVRYISTERYVDFKLAFKNEELKGKDGYYQLIPIATDSGKSLLGSNLNKEEFEKLNLVHNIIASASFNKRLAFHMDEMQEKGYFDYGGYQFKYNGDILNKGNFITNLSEEIKERNVYFGMDWQGFRWSEENPFEFFITSKSVRIKIFGMESGMKVKTNTYVNHDVFKALMEYYVLNDRYPNY